MNTNYSDFEKLYSAKGFHENGTLLLSELTNYLKKTAESTSPALSFIEPQEMLRYWQSWNDNTRHLSESERIQKFCTDLLSYTNHLQNPKYIGHQVSAPLPIASLMMLIGGISNNGSAVLSRVVSCLTSNVPLSVVLPWTVPCPLTCKSKPIVP